MPTSRRRPPGPSLFSSVVVSALTTVAVFFALREAENRGLLGGVAGTVTVPEIVGMNDAQAAEVLKVRGLLLGLQEKRFDPKIPAGAIAAQTPLPGSQATQGSTVNAVVSSGAISVPATAGLTPEGARSTLSDLGLLASDPVPTPHETIEAGLIIQSDPVAGTNVASGRAIKLLVSSGPAAAEVPRVVGQRITRARTMLEEAGFVVGATRWGYSDYQDGSVVLRQTPEAGTKAAPGTKIDLVVNEPE